MIPQQFEILDCLADPVLVIDASYTIIYANSAMADLCGLEFDRIIGCQCHRLSHQCPHPCSDAELQGQSCSHAHVFTTGTPLRQQHPHQMPDGTTKIFDMTSSPLREAGGRITHVIQVLRDITEQEELRALAASKQYELERLFSLSPFFITSIDTDMRVRWINLALEELIGLSSREACGRYCYELWNHKATTADDGRKKAQQGLCDGCPAPRAMREGATQTHEAIIGERSFEIVTVPLTSANGETTGAIKFGFDITARRKTEDELRNSERRLRTLFEKSPTPLCVADFSGIKRCLDTLRQNGVNDLVAYLADHREDTDKCLEHIKILDVNQATLALLGLPSKQAFFARIEFLLKKIPLHENPQGLLAMARGEKSCSHELTVYSAADEKLHTIIHWSVEPGYEQNYEQVLFTIVDITDRIKAERAILTNAEQMRVLHEIDKAILEARSVEEIGRVTLTLLQNHVRCASGCVILFDLEKQRSSLLACSREAPSCFCADRKLAFSSAEYLENLDEGQFILMEDILTEEKTCPICEMLLAEDFRFFLSVPLLTKSGLLGALNLLDTDPRSLPAEQIAFICKVAPFLAVAIQDARLLASLNRQKEELRTLTRRLAEAEETERRRLAAELHDEVGQNLSALAINLDILHQQLPLPDAAAEKRLADSIALIDQLTGQVRTVMADLRPPVMDDYGLLASLLWLADRYMTRTGIQVRVQGSEPRSRLAAAKEMALFRVAQEALTNTAKHARATMVDIELRPGESSIRLTIRDNGRGFDRQELPTQDSPEHWGLLSMRERVEVFKGRFSLDSAPGAGTAITVEVPT